MLHWRGKKIGAKISFFLLNIYGVVRYIIAKTISKKIKKNVEQIIGLFLSLISECKAASSKARYLRRAVCQVVGVGKPNR